MKGTAKLTFKQKEVLKFIRQKIHSDNLPPTIREIARHFRFSSTGTVRDHLSSLITKGYLKVSKGKARGIELVEDIFRIPIVGRIVAGVPNLASEDIEGYLNLGNFLTYDEQLFALRVKGDSMVEAGIMPGDLVIVRRQPQAEGGEIVIALIEDETTVKILHRRRGKFYLKPANRNYQPIPLDKTSSIIGKVVGVLRRYV